MYFCFSPPCFVTMETCKWAITESAACLSRKETERHLLSCCKALVRVFGCVASQAHFLFVWLHLQICCLPGGILGTFLNDCVMHVAFLCRLKENTDLYNFAMRKKRLKAISQTGGQRSDELSATATSQSKAICCHVSVSPLVLIYEASRRDRRMWIYLKHLMPALTLQDHDALL